MLKKILKLTDVFAIKIIGVLSTSIIVFFLQKKFGNEVQGLYGVLSNTILLLTVLCQFGIPSLTSLHISINKKYNHSKSQEIISRCFKVLFIIQPLFIPLIIFQSSNIFSNWFHITLLILSIFLNVFIYFFAYILRGFNKYGWMIYLTESMRWIIIFLLIFSLNTFFKIEELIVYSIFIASLGTFLLGYYRVRLLGFVLFKKFNFINFKLIKFIILSSSPFVISSFCILCLQQMNIIQLLYYSSFEDVGVFNFTYKYLAFSIMPVSVISAKYAQIASEYYFKSMKSEVRRIFYNSTFASLIIASSLVVFLFIVAKYVYFYVNQDFNLQLFIIIGLSMLIFSIYGFWISFLIMIKKGKSTAILLVIAVFCNLLLNSIITPERGYFGSAISDLLSHLLALIMCIYFLIKFSIIEYK